jgi:hypothetical protein
MADTPTTQQLKSEIASARADLHQDLSMLDHQIHADLPAQIQSAAPLLATGAAALGLMVGLGGTKALKRLVVIGVPLAAAAIYLQRRRT